MTSRLLMSVVQLMKNDYAQTVIGAFIVYLYCGSHHQHSLVGDRGSIYPLLIHILSLLPTWGKGGVAQQRDHTENKDSSPKHAGRRQPVCDHIVKADINDHMIKLLPNHYWDLELFSASCQTVKCRIIFLQHSALCIMQGTHSLQIAGWRKLKQTCTEDLWWLLSLIPCSEHVDLLTVILFKWHWFSDSLTRKSTVNVSSFWLSCSGLVTQKVLRPLAFHFITLYRQVSFNIYLAANVFG